MIRSGFSVVARFLTTGLFLAGSALFAQFDTGSITVTLKDGTGAVVTDTPIVLHNQATGIDLRTGVTNEQGSYTFICR
jgi:hypothetical protein